MRLNNRGFAISGVLYTLMILFLLLLVTVLAGLSSRLRMMSRSITVMEDDYSGRLVEGERLSEVYDASLKKALVTGKYMFQTEGLDNGVTNEAYCVAYMYKNTSLNDISFVQSDCDVFLDYLVLKKVYVFEE